MGIKPEAIRQERDFEMKLSTSRLRKALPSSSSLKKHGNEAFHKLVYGKKYDDLEDEENSLIERSASAEGEGSDDSAFETASPRSSYELVESLQILVVEIQDWLSHIDVGHPDRVDYYKMRKVLSTAGKQQTELVQRIESPAEGESLSEAALCLMLELNDQILYINRMFDKMEKRLAAADRERPDPHASKLELSSAATASSSGSSNARGTAPLPPPPTTLPPPPPTTTTTAPFDIFNDPTPTQNAGVAMADTLFFTTPSSDSAPSHTATADTVDLLGSVTPTCKNGGAFEDLFAAPSTASANQDQLADLFASLPQSIPSPEVERNTSARFLVHNADQFEMGDDLPSATEPVVNTVKSLPWGTYGARGDTTQLLPLGDSTAQDVDDLGISTKALGSKSYADSTLKWIKRKTGSDPDASSLLAKETVCDAPQKAICDAGDGWGEFDTGGFIRN